MNPPRKFPEGVLQLYEVIDGVKTLIEELPSTSKNRVRIQQIRNDLLVVNPKRNLVLTENNAF